MILQIHKHKLSLMHQCDESSLVEPLLLLDLAYESDLKVKIVRHLSQEIVISSELACFSLMLSMAGNVERDLATLIIRESN